MINLVFRNENSFKIWYTNSSFQQVISSACYRFTYKIWGIDTYLPREGPETTPPPQSQYPGNQSIATYLPREGPETNLINLLFSMFLYSHQLTSRGAGNAVIDSVQIIEFSIATYLPREGPETVIERIEWIVVCCVQILIYLARGREQKSTVISIRPREIVQLPIHLARGRQK